ncbi:hypothetical protein ACIBLA_22685 [Streptomyces sp. NPDC050433]|uniref:hypothetical protein n=1 Tax=unclassified Streptomyces TaxID=2593676 RepID=UPI0034407396
MLARTTRGAYGETVIVGRLPVAGTPDSPDVSLVAVATWHRPTRSPRRTPR